LEEKNKQLEDVQTDTKVLNDKLSTMEKSLEHSLSELEKEKSERMDQSLKRAKTEVVSELKSIYLACPFSPPLLSLSSYL
jgi:hypothetical protein